jgi:triosephosphate isomerase
MKRTPLIAANWKMHSAPSGWDTEESPYRTQETVEVIVFPTALDIRSCVEKFLIVGAQYGRPEETGAFTGDMSMSLLATHGCTYVLCGHSERRKHHAESDAFIALQVEAAIKAGLHPILCVGETADERELGQAKEVVERQLASVIAHSLPITIAYEPVWAIGNGISATPVDAEEMHAFIRSLLPDTLQETTRIIYGGSVKPDCAEAILQQPNIDGALVGAASLDPRAFRAIIEDLPS